MLERVLGVCLGFCLGSGDAPLHAAAPGAQKQSVSAAAAADRPITWGRWRGPGGTAVLDSNRLPIHWSRTKNVAWAVTLPGEGYSSPIIADDRVFVTYSIDEGLDRHLLCLNLESGGLVWDRTIEDDFPEIASAITGHAASTPLTNGARVVAFFGNAGVVCFDVEGKLIWRRKLGYFETELGLASSPILHGELVIVVCDHDGDRFSSFDSFLIALDINTGKTVWKTDRRGLFRSWSTPIVIAASGKDQLIVNGQDELRSYDVASGLPLWDHKGMTGWVTPSPIWDGAHLIATSGKNGPIIAIRPSETATGRSAAWKQATGGPYVCSPLAYRGRLYVHNQTGMLSCFNIGTGELVYRHRFGKKFTASGVAGGGQVYLLDEDGTTHVFASGDRYSRLAANQLDEFSLASPALTADSILIRTRTRLLRIRSSRQ